jgi:hypothetical protein
MELVEKNATARVRDQNEGISEGEEILKRSAGK